MRPRVPCPPARERSGCATAGLMAAAVCSRQRLKERFRLDTYDCWCLLDVTGAEVLSVSSQG